MSVKNQSNFPRIEQRNGIGHSICDSLTATFSPEITAGAQQNDHVKGAIKLSDVQQLQQRQSQQTLDNQQLLQKIFSAIKTYQLPRQMQNSPQEYILQANVINEQSGPKKIDGNDKINENMFPVLVSKITEESQFPHQRFGSASSPMHNQIYASAHKNRYNISNDSILNKAVVGSQREKIPSSYMQTNKNDLSSKLDIFNGNSANLQDSKSVKDAPSTYSKSFLNETQIGDKYITPQQSHSSGNNSRNSRSPSLTQSQNFSRGNQINTNQKLPYDSYTSKTFDHKKQFDMNNPFLDNKSQIDKFQFSGITSPMNLSHSTQINNISNKISMYGQHFQPSLSGNTSKQPARSSRKIEFEDQVPSNSSLLSQVSSTAPDNSTHTQLVFSRTSQLPIGSSSQTIGLASSHQTTASENNPSEYTTSQERQQFKTLSQDRSSQTMQLIKDHIPSNLSFQEQELPREPDNSIHTQLVYSRTSQLPRGSSSQTVGRANSNSTNTSGIYRSENIEQNGQESEPFRNDPSGSSKLTKFNNQFLNISNSSKLLTKSITQLVQSSASQLPMGSSFTSSGRDDKYAGSLKPTDSYDADSQYTTDNYYDYSTDHSDVSNTVSSSTLNSSDPEDRIWYDQTLRVIFSSQNKNENSLNPRKPFDLTKSHSNISEINGHGKTNNDTTNRAVVIDNSINKSQDNAVSTDREQRTGEAQNQSENYVHDEAYHKTTGSASSNNSNQLPSRWWQDKIERAQLHTSEKISPLFGNQQQEIAPSTVRNDHLNNFKQLADVSNQSTQNKEGHYKKKFTEMPSEDFVRSLQNSSQSKLTGLPMQIDSNSVSLEQLSNAVLRNNDSRNQTQKAINNFTDNITSKSNDKQSSVDVESLMRNASTNTDDQQEITSNSELTILNQMFVQESDKNIKQENSRDEYLNVTESIVTAESPSQQQNQRPLQTGNSNNIDASSSSSELRNISQSQRRYNPIRQDSGVSFQTSAESPTLESRRFFNNFDFMDHTENSNLQTEQAIPRESYVEIPITRIKTCFNPTTDDGHINSTSEPGQKQQAGHCYSKCSTLQSQTQLNNSRNICNCSIGEQQACSYTDLLHLSCGGKSSVYQHCPKLTCNNPVNLCDQIPSQRFLPPSHPKLISDCRPPQFSPSRPRGPPQSLAHRALYALQQGFKVRLQKDGLSRKLMDDYQQALNALQPMPSMNFF